MRGHALAALILTGCGFEVPAKGGSGIDAAPLIDAPIDAPGTMACPWPYAPAGFDPCTGTPAGMLPELDLQEDGVYVFNTESKTFRDPNGQAITVPITDVGDSTVIWTRLFRIGVGTTLRAIGDPSFVLVSQSSVTIDGTLDVGSYTAGTNVIGAGSDPDSCMTSAGGDGLSCTHGGSGGGGAGFSTAGAQGGPGGFGRDCSGQPVSTGIPGGAGGGVTADMTFRAGCDAGDGADGDNPNGGDAGDGGGAIHVVARDALVVSGTGRVLAGGAGGVGGNGGRSGGGGGGSGGMIVLGATTIQIEATGVLAANGGGGGGGANGGQAEDGEDGQPSLLAARGGQPEGNNGVGGNGASAAAVATPGTGVDRGGGGGGGGMGRIRLILKPGNTAVTTGAILSPIPTN